MPGAMPLRVPAERHAVSRIRASKSFRRYTWSRCRAFASFANACRSGSHGQPEYSLTMAPGRGCEMENWKCGIECPVPCLYAYPRKGMLSVAAAQASLSAGTLGAGCHAFASFANACRSGSHGQPKYSLTVAPGPPHTTPPKAGAAPFFQNFLDKWRRDMLSE
jgi:hypothetical protein